MNRIVPEAEYRELRQYDHEDGREEGEDREEQGQVVPREPLDLGAQRSLVLWRPTAKILYNILVMIGITLSMNSIPLIFVTLSFNLHMFAISFSIFILYPSTVLSLNCIFLWFISMWTYIFPLFLSLSSPCMSLFCSISLTWVEGWPPALYLTSRWERWYCLPSPPLWATDSPTK